MILALGASGPGFDSPYGPFGFKPILTRVAQWIRHHASNVRIVGSSPIMGIFNIFLQLIFSNPLFFEKINQNLFYITIFARNNS